ncbi:MAG TPA: hypothetical protein VHW45_11985 [Candidatus Sulfotelmatobacter sp.]|nr:hypothetical protein [Candidatus Sulfotelmatobacter sp.]
MSLTAQESAGAMLRSSSSGVLVNRNPVPASIALFRGDIIETSKGAVARIELTGSTVDVAPQTMVQFDGDELVLDYGGLAVDSSRGLRVRVGCVTILPVDDAVLTHYQVVDQSGRITDSSLKRDTYMDSQSKNRKQVKQTEDSQRTIVHEGEQQSREDKCGAGYTNGPPPPGSGPILNSMWARAAGVGAVGALTCWVLCFQKPSPVSPSHP